MNSEPAHGPVATVEMTREALLAMGQYVTGVIRDHGVMYPQHVDTLVLMFAFLDERLARLEHYSTAEFADFDD